MAVFFQHAAEGKMMPTAEWKHETEGDSYRLKIQSKTAPKAVRLWMATSGTKDFRESKWTSGPIPETNGSFLGVVPKPPAGHVALYGEIQFNAYGHDYSVTTQIRRE